MQVKEKFSKQVHSYESYALLQKQVAGRLADSLRPWRLALPPGIVLELGAGTGFYTRELTQLLPGRGITVTDISGEMLSFCKNRLADLKDDELKFELLDAERFKSQGQRYALITGNFVVQWFKDPALTLSRFVEALAPGGLLLVSYPGCDSFPEWHARCLELGLPYTGNSLPDTEELVVKLAMGPVKVDFYEDSQTVEFPDSFSFFRHLKQIGADTTLHNKQLTHTQFKRLTNHWDSTLKGPVRVTWHLVFLAACRT